ncbi:putative oxidoreductase, GFO/IDH/MOCA family (plasmid) [Phaeobacter piscinae]|nr:putative oxidoreductase, GFO/IDH/MOCA family [Phaeobacter piscinae]
MTTERKTRLKLGMVGGGQGAFIGAVHRIAARMDDRFQLVAGALSSDPARAAASAAELGIAPDRSYTSFEEMARAEAAREDGIDAVAIVTPNHLHAGPSIAFLNAGIHVICDKPLAASAAEAEAMKQAAATGVAYGWGRNSTLRVYWRAFRHLYSPVSRICAHPRGEMCESSASGLSLPSFIRAATARPSCFVFQ